MTATSPYKILNVTQDADAADVKQAYRLLAKQYHPDVSTNRDNGAASGMFQQVQEAYKLLSDPPKRKRYDAMRRMVEGDAADEPYQGDLVGTMRQAGQAAPQGTGAVSSMRGGMGGNAPVVSSASGIYAGTFVSHSGGSKGQPIGVVTGVSGSGQATVQVGGKASVKAQTPIQTPLSSLAAGSRFLVSGPTLRIKGYVVARNYSQVSAQEINISIEVMCNSISTSVVGADLHKILSSSLSLNANQHIIQTDYMPPLHAMDAPRLNIEILETI